jgi:TRAP-type C4-dicarboxylate transport system permease small subunit
VKRFLEKLNALILLCMFGVTVLTVIFRGVLGVAASWSEDLAQLTFILLVFVGAAVLMEDEGHIRINTLVERLGKRGQRVMRILGRLLSLPFLVLFGLGAWDNALVNWDVELGTVEWIRIGHMYLALVLTTAVMIFYLGANIARDLKGTWRESSGLNSTV